MEISVTEFKHRCLEIIRRVEKTDKGVTITRHGKVVARLEPSLTAASAGALKPWERLRGSAVCLFEAGESVLKDEDFEARGVTVAGKVSEAEGSQKLKGRVGFVDNSNPTPFHLFNCARG